ncbi:IDEAL domain-containing protein [Ferdinandcohnia quinoae]|uniref:IDEAL domain-containing protein n=1 Tax=Fredinandcohnia quinoae TaxID=2918902 RepID=A0AAW5E1I3_9BACI|nr:IDEAL domain-containing protein [Fredinandcohnia sp. SECRCQ15]MCH1623967.1 IDEAL domain-containing protein [Fredinandcohnia sp. SECRCQ15]
MNHFKKEQKNELIVIPNALEDDEELYEKVAEMVLYRSQISFQKEKLMERIDQSLINRNKEAFMELSKQYITLQNK